MKCREEYYDPDICFLHALAATIYGAAGAGLILAGFLVRRSETEPPSRRKEVRPGGTVLPKDD